MKKALSVVTLFLAGLAPLLAQAQSVPATPTVAGVEFRVIVPESVQLTINIHSSTTAPTVVQILEVKTTVPGTCITLSNRSQDPSWSVDSDSPEWLFKQTSAGYLFCTDQVGRVSLTLTHRFSTSGQPFPVFVTAGTKP